MKPTEDGEALLERLRGGDGAALGELFELHRARLWRMLHVRLDHRLAARVSADDVLQEAFLDVARRVGEYLADPKVPFYVWLRFLTLQRMHSLQRAHLGARIRDAALEERLAFASSESMAGQLVGHLTSPSQAAMRHELQARLRAALDEMDPLDREVLALRHFEELSNNEVAEVLNLSKEAASKRHVRALKRLRAILEDANGSAPA
jgi:RNA polymerase sigma-70 factor (ECF subfamily)